MRHSSLFDRGFKSRSRLTDTERFELGKCLMVGMTITDHVIFCHVSSLRSSRLPSTICQHLDKIWQVWPKTDHYNSDHTDDNQILNIIIECIRTECVRMFFQRVKTLSTFAI